MPACPWVLLQQDARRGVEIPVGFSERNRWQKQDEHHRTLAFYAWLMEDFLEARVLDLGSGPGTVSLPLAQLQSVATVVCYDSDARALSVVEENARELQVTNVSTVIGATPHQLPFSEGSFDVVVCRAALHHFADRAGAVSEARRCLRPGGLLLLTETALPEHSRDTTHALYVAREASFAGYLTYHELTRLVVTMGFQIGAMRPYDYQRGTLDDFLVDSDPAAKEMLAAAWCALDRKTLEELKWSGKREGQFITYPVIDIAGYRASS